jgi:hypothetical protein
VRKNPLGEKIGNADQEAYTRADGDDAAADRSHHPKFKNLSTAREALLKGVGSGWGSLREQISRLKGRNGLQKQRPRGRLSLYECLVCTGAPGAGEKVLSTSIQLAVGLNSRSSSYFDRRMF